MSEKSISFYKIKERKENRSMNFLDIILIVIMVVLIITAIVLLIIYAREDEVGLGITIFISCVIFASLPLLGFIRLDAGSGSTIGTITSVDKNLFGTTAVFVKTCETSQEEYCIEDEEVAKIARDLIGKNVKVYYGERIGLYSTGRCSEAPIEKIEVVSK